MPVAPVTITRRFVALGGMPIILPRLGANRDQAIVIITAGLLDRKMIGEILDAKYRIDKQLGAGGMGNVYLATHLGTTRVVAVKVIAPKWATEPQFLARFQREAQACGRLRHPNIVNVTDFGIARAERGQIAYLVMELLDGQTLSSFQETHPRPELPQVADLLD